ncbi:MAG TPA: hypothetical protein VG407_11045 [Caulobacteraceae bacterium]|jgi:hypothetical protein|nr:hypothetical protein [Caulobacteraceae bacterium]
MDREAVGAVNSVVKGYIVALFMLYGAGRASAQDCPNSSPGGGDTPSQTQTLAGRLIYHDGIRQWYELKLDRRRCGQNSVQLIVPDNEWKLLEVTRGCRVKATGKLDFPFTGYYSLDVYQDAISVSPIGACLKKPAFADYSNAMPDRHVRAYRVTMDVEYRPGDHPIKFHVRSGRRELRPWQAYASYSLTGSFVLYGECGRGFVVDKVYGTPSARPLHFTAARDPSDKAAFDPERAAQAGKINLHLGYSCIRGH